MCTVSIVPLDDGFRLACNRDELTTRPRALPPALRHSGGRTLVYPLDPESGGTWIGANDAGLVLALLNATAGAPGPHSQPQYSRGLIIPPLLELDSLPGAVAALGRVDPHRFRPFRLVAVQGRQIGVVASDMHRLTAEIAPLHSSVMFTSSSIGDLVVDPPRRRLFDRIVLGARGSPLGAQRRFHAHRWPERLDISVSMSRTDAATVSRSLVVVRGDLVRFEYAPLDEAARVAS